ncbi:MAG: AI-2E family transporter [Oscillospiraceae bacterium]|nr:AI-2E family transporter [Oscillospiraceae bacterium]
MKVDWNSKYTTISAYTVITFSICLVMVIFVAKFSAITGALGTAVDTLSSFVWGFVIAFLLNPIMMAVEKLMKKLVERKKPHPKLCRFIGTIAAILFGFAVIAALIAIIVPQVLESLMKIFSNAQNYINNIYTWINTTLAEYPDIATYLNGQLDKVEATVLNAVNSLIPKVGDWAIKLKDGAVGFAIALKDFIIGFIVAVYLLLDKEKFIAQCRKINIALFPEKVSTEIGRIFSKINKSLNGFITGKILDSFIIGMICFILMTIFKMEFPVLISTIIGITNIIPFFGPFIGAIPSALLLLISAPSQTLWFILMILVLQQFDGNILGPHILGDSTGLPAFWVMFAIFLGGGLFGFAGMLLGVPIFAVIYALIQEIIESLLKKKGLPSETEAYYPNNDPVENGNKPKIKKEQQK